MANRPVYCTSDRFPYVRQIDVDFEYYSGFHISQKQKSIKSLHNAFKLMYSDKNVLEVSSSSYQDKGIEFSAFNLKKYVKTLGQSVPVENIFQSSKVFEDGGPYIELLTLSPKEAKKKIKELAGPNLIKFSFEGKDYPLEPKTVFYDFIYMNALLDNMELISTLLEYDAFTDINFNPNKSINCQAKTCATFVSIYKLGRIDILDDFDKFYAFISNK